MSFRAGSHGERLFSPWAFSTNPRQIHTANLPWLLFSNLAVTYYITAREQLSSQTGPLGREPALKQKVRAAFSARVDYVQVREKDLPARRLALLVEELVASPQKQNSRLLVNERWDVAAYCGADGIHLPADSVPLAMLRSLAGKAMVLGVSCHCGQDVAQAVRDGTSYVLLGPIFETPSKPGAKPLGLAALRDVCRRYPVPIYALGGVTAANAEECIQAGAAGVAGIRLFQQALDLEELCRRLRLL